jgi:hypothetical protein
MLNTVPDVFILSGRNFLLETNTKAATVLSNIKIPPDEIQTYHKLLYNEIFYFPFFRTGLASARSCLALCTTPTCSVSKAPVA